MTRTLLQQAVEALTDEERSDLRAGACVFRCPPYDKNPQSQRIGDLMERLAALQQQPEPVAGTAQHEFDAMRERSQHTKDGLLADKMRYRKALLIACGRNEGKVLEALRLADAKLTAPPALQQQEEPREVAPRDLYAKWITTYGMNVEECSMPNYDYLSPAEHAAWEAVAALASPSPQDFTLPMLEEGKGADAVAEVSMPVVRVGNFNIPAPVPLTPGVATVAPAQECRYPRCDCVVKLDGSWQGCKAISGVSRPDSETKPPRPTDGDPA